jgi:integrase
VRGTIRQRSAGSWTVIVDLGPDPVSGRRRQHWKTVRGPKREAEAELAKLIHERSTGIEQPTGHETVAEYLDRWLRDYVATNTAPKTDQT